MKKILPTLLLSFVAVTNGNAQTVDPENPNVYHLVDGTPYTNTKKKSNVTVTYTRRFDNQNLQPLFIPFNMPYEVWSKDFDVYYINGGNNNPEGTVFKLARLDEAPAKTVLGSTANFFYLIKPKHAIDGEYTFTVENTTVYRATDVTARTTEIKTNHLKFIFNGTYEPMNNMASSHYYGMADNKLCLAANDDVTLSSYRWYMRVTDEEGTPMPLKANIVLVIGDEEVTGIDNLDFEPRQTNTGVYSIDGKKMDEKSLRPGLYIKNGKKFIVK